MPEEHESLHHGPRHLGPPRPGSQNPVPQPRSSSDAEPTDLVPSRLALSPRRDRIVLVGSLGILSAVSPLATDMYLASLPQMAQWFGAPASLVQLTLTAYMVGMAAGQFLLGPLSDVLGRRRLMIAGNLVFVLSSAGIVLAPDVRLVLALRLLQGVAGAAGVVIARAVVSDIARGRRAAQLYSVLSLITSLAPVVAPLAGGDRLRGGLAHGLRGAHGLRRGDARVLGARGPGDPPAGSPLPGRFGAHPAQRRDRPG